MNPKRRQVISQGLQSMGSLGVLYLLSESELARTVAIAAQTPKGEAVLQSLVTQSSTNP